MAKQRTLANSLHTPKMMTWHPGMQKCGFCDHPATRQISAGNGSTSSVCDNHIRCGSGMGDGLHGTYLVQQEVMNHLLAA